MGIVWFALGMIAGATVVALVPPLFRLAARIRAWVGDNVRLPSQ